MRRLAFVSTIVMMLTACGSASSSGDNDAAGDPRPTVATTVAPLTDLVERVGRGDVHVVGLVPPGVDSHTHEPSPSDAVTLSDADLVIVNGLFLEQPTIDLAEANVPPGTAIVALADQVVSEDEWVFDWEFPEDEGRPNPHLWTNPPMAAEYVRIIAEVLTEVAPDAASGFHQRADALVADIDGLDRAIEAAWATIDAADRLLVTYHDSFPYFAPRYGVTQIAAIQPSDFSEPSAREVASIIDQVREHDIPAIFGSEVFPSGVLSQIASETGADYVDDLADDELPGEPGDPEHSYIGMMVDNVRTMVTALGGNASALDAVDPRRTE